MSARKELVIELNKEQQEKIKKSLDREVTHLRLWLVPRTVVLAETVNRHET
jgi:hypothetical protein